MIRAWALDDEPLALRRLVRMLEETGRVQVVGHATDPTEALERLNTASFDALFLDIEMPGLNGFDLLQRLTVSPAIVLTTAFDRYAVKAFEANGTDYLLKPITPEALARAVARLEQKASPAPADYRAMLEIVPEGGLVLPGTKSLTLKPWVTPGPSELTRLTCL